MNDLPPAGASGTSSQSGAPSQAQLAELEATLRRVVTAMERNQRRGGMEVLIVIILSLATLSSTWCGYQARLWGAKQATSQASADTAERQSAEDTIVGLQVRTQEGIIVLEYWRALREEDEKSASTILAHMRPQLRRAIEASIEGGIMTNPEALGPLQRPEYVIAAEVSAKEHREDASRFRSEAARAGSVASEYVLLTLMLASVLFFGGISGTFTHRPVRRALALVALLVFGVAIWWLLRLPLVWD